jgi:hypothetical protein
MNACPRDTIATFKRLTNMSPAQIRAWAKNPAAKRASFEATRRRLPALAALTEKIRRGADLSARDCAFAQRVNNFNTRMGGMRRQWGCTDKIVISLRNWGHQSPGCPMPR